MNKRYMDFVPSDSAKKTNKVVKNAGSVSHSSTTRVLQEEETVVRVVNRGSTSAGSASVHPVSTRSSAPRPSTRVISRSTPKVTMRSAAQSSPRSTAQLSPRSAAQSSPRSANRPTARSVSRSTTRVSARSMSRGTERGSTNGMSRKAYVPPETERPTRGRRAVKNGKVDFGVIEELEPVGDKVKAERKPSTSKTMAIPRTPFINQNRVEKRPLSKNVYRQKTTPSPEKEKAVGPVTIIAKPEKEKHVGLIISIILTIILGAAAGTVAFLLLPK